MAFIYERRQSGKLWCTPAAGVEFQRKQSNQCKKISKRDDLVYSRHALFSDGCNFSRTSTESFNWADRPMTALCHVSPFPLNSFNEWWLKRVCLWVYPVFLSLLVSIDLFLKENEPQGIHSLKTLIDNNGSWSCLCHCLLGCSFAFIFVFQGAKSCSNLFWHTNFCTKAVQHRKKARKFNHRDSC